MDTSNEDKAARKKWVTGALIFVVAASFIFFLGVIVKFWVTQPDPSAELIVQADPYYNQAEIVIETEGMTQQRKTIDTAKVSQYHFFLTPGISKIKIFRDQSLFYEESVDIRSGQSNLTLKPPASSGNP